VSPERSLSDAARGRAYGFLRSLRVALPLTLYRKGLRDSGWRRSNRMGRPVDSAGNPIPWYTYSAVHLLDQRLGRDLRVFEYGAGNSTLWYAKRVAHVVAVEHEPAWAELVSATAPANVEIALRPRREEYTAEIDGHAPFDVVVIDSQEWRVECARHAVARLTPTGVVVWDNSDRGDFREAFGDLDLFSGFRELPLFGLAPFAGTLSTTSILYRPENCLGI
jgi:hypothetical protein